MKKKPLILLGLLAIIVVITAVASNNPGSNETTSHPTTTGVSTSSSSSAPRVVSVEWESVYTVSTPGERVLTGVRANPRTAIVSFTTILRTNFMVEKYYMTITYSVAGGTTTEILTLANLMSTRVITAVGAGTVAVVSFDGTVITNSSWRPAVFDVFAPFSPLVVKDSTTYFVMRGDVLEAVTLTEWGTVAKISHRYTKVFDGTTVEKTVLMTGTMRDFSTLVSVYVFTDFPVHEYPWISDGTTVLPVVIVDGVIERERTVLQWPVKRVEVEFYSVAGDSVPTYFVGYRAMRESKMSGSSVVVYYGSVALTGTAAGGGSFVVTIRDLVSGSNSPSLTTFASFITNFYILSSTASLSSILVNGTPVLVARYEKDGLAFAVTFDRDYAVMSGVYRVVTDESGGYFVLRTFALYNLGIVGVTSVTRE